MPIQRFATAAALALLFGNCAIDDGAIEEPSLPPEEEPQTPTPPGEPGEPPPGETMSEAAARVFNQFKSCMTFADFQTANMTAWSTVTTTGVGHQCRSCHASGGNGFIATEQAQFMFDTIKNTDHLLRAFVIPDGTTPAVMKVVVNRPVFVNAGAGGIVEHPRFDPDNNAGMTALRRFYDLTMQRISTVCAPSPS